MATARKILLSYRKLFKIDPMQSLTPIPDSLDDSQNDFLVRSALLLLRTKWDQPFTKLARMAVAATGGIPITMQDPFDPGEVPFVVENEGTIFETSNVALHHGFAMLLTSELAEWVDTLQTSGSEVLKLRDEGKPLPQELSAKTAYYWLAALSLHFYYPLLNSEKYWQKNWLIENSEKAFRIDDIKSLPPGIKELVLVRLVRTSMQIVEHPHSQPLADLEKMMAKLVDLKFAETGKKKLRTTLDEIRDVITNTKDPKLKKLIAALMKKDKLKQIRGIQEALQPGLSPCTDNLQNLASFVGKKRRRFPPH